MPVTGIDHVAAPMERVDEMESFYRALGFEVREAAEGRMRAVHAGSTKVNFHVPALWQKEEFTLRGLTALPGSGDFCFVWDGTADDLAATLAGAGAEPIEGPVAREGARGTGTSTYVRDPDGNLVEFIIY